MVNPIPFLKKLKLLLYSIVNSYSQIFFSNGLILGLILILVTFFDFFSGFCGLVSVIITNSLAYFIGLNREKIKSGLLGFNSLLVGLGIGNFFEHSVEIYLILFTASLMTLIFTVSIDGVLSKYGLPFLSLPFLLGIWIITLATRDYSSLIISERGLFRLNEMYLLGGEPLMNAFQWFNNLDIPKSIVIFFRSLGAIFFQYYLFAGLLIAIGILIYSRIAFMLALLGFYTAYLFYKFIGADISDLSYHYIGFNYILTSIAIGGFFVIPSKHSILWSVLLVPVVSILISATTQIFNIYQLPIYSLPFNIVVILYIYFLKFRYNHYFKPQLVVQQHYSPEKNLYLQTNSKERFSKSVWIPLSLPFWGNWKVTQGHKGEHTHKGDWQYAWDFEIADKDGNTFQNDGFLKEDYFCYSKPIVSPADGWIENIVDGIDDNEINDVNTQDNWGNTIIIKHSQYLFSKISHIKQGSFKVNIGDYIRKGDVLALCGNSGRSPVPHIHFQLQTSPHISSGSLMYPISHYIKYNNAEINYLSFEYPKKDEIISNIEVNRLLSKAYHFIPGKKINVEITGLSKNAYFETWEIFTDIYNNSYIYSHNSESSAWFVNDGQIFFFTTFLGNKNSALFQFYLSSYKVLLGYYENLKIQDSFPISILKNNPLLLIHDFIAPFYQAIRVKYCLEYINSDDALNTKNIFLKSKTSVNLFSKLLTETNSVIELSEEKISKVTMDKIDKQIVIRFL